MKTIKHITRSNLPKPKTFKLRNYRPAEEVAAELAAQKQKKLNKEIKKINNNNILERNPNTDTYDYSHEEDGYFLSKGKKVNIIFPR